MFYSNNNSYMEDLYYYNQIPNNTYLNGLGNNPMTSGVINPNLGNNMSPNFGFMNPNPVYGGQLNNGQSMGIMQLMNLYPSIYRIINPVVSRVLSNSNNQMINEDFLNNMVDTVFNIVEGQINVDEESNIKRNLQNDNQTNINSSSNNSSSNIGSSNRNQENIRQNNNSMQNNISSNNKNDNLLRDLIKILIIKELLFRHQNYQRQYITNQSGINAGYNTYF